MKKLIPSLFLIISCISLVSCSNSPNSTTQATSTNTAEQSQSQTSPESTTESEGKTETSVQTESTSQTVSSTPKKNQTTRKKLPKQPQIGTVKELVNGDLLCYVTLVDEKGKERQVGASFEICAEESKFLNKKVRAVYTVESVNDCQSAEPCGKTRQESIITKMEVLDDKTSSKPENTKSATFNAGNEIVSGEIATEKTPSPNKTQTISNGEWTITTGNHDSWTGVNNTGNISYKGCDAKGKCIELTGGKISCRDGICVTGWTNGDYTYILEQPITEDGNADSTLTVRKGETEILKATGLKAVPNN